MSKNVREVLKQVQQDKAEETNREALDELIRLCAEYGSATKLERVWSCSLRLRRSEMVRTWNQKERGQGVQLGKEIGYHAAAVLLSEAVLHWEDVNQELVRQFGKGCSHAEPSLPWILYYRVAILNYLANESSVAEFTHKWSS